MGFLSGYRILDLTDERGYLCGRILGDLGADVIKVEPPGGDRGRRRGPFYGFPHPERSLYFMFYNLNKRGITLDITKDDGRELLKELVKRADAVVESFDAGFLESIGLSYEELLKVNPRLIMTSITPFGQDGPYRDYKASDINLWALGGMMYLCGDPERAPVEVTFPQSYLHAGGDGACATIMALYYRDKTGEGQRIDISIHSCVPWTTMSALEYWPLNKLISKRAGARRIRLVTMAYERQVWKCKEGYVHFLQIGGMAGARFMNEMMKWLDEEGLLTDKLRGIKWEEVDGLYLPQEMLDELEKPLAQLFSRYTAWEIYKEAIRRRIQILPVSTAKDISEDIQLKERDFWVYVEYPFGRIKFPGPFAKFTREEIRIKRSPFIGEHNEEIYMGELGLSRKDMELLMGVGVI